MGKRTLTNLFRSSPRSLWPLSMRIQHRKNWKFATFYWAKHTFEHSQKLWKDVAILLMSSIPNSLHYTVRPLPFTRLTNCGLTDQCIPYLKSTTITHLYLDDNSKLTEASYKLLADPTFLPNLHHLSLGQNHITDSIILTIAPFLSQHHIKGLYLWKNNIGNDGCKVLTEVKPQY